MIRAKCAALLIFSLASTVVFAGCLFGDDDDGGSGPLGQPTNGGSTPIGGAPAAGGIIGFWRLTETVTSASSYCDEDIGTSSTEDIEFVQQSGSIVLTGYGGQINPPWAVAYDPDRGTVTFEGSFDDEGGVTTGLFALTLEGDDMGGEKNWTWQDCSGFCTDGISVVEGSKR